MTSSVENPSLPQGFVSHLELSIDSVSRYRELLRAQDRGKISLAGELERIGMDFWQAVCAAEGQAGKHGATTGAEDGGRPPGAGVAVIPARESDETICPACHSASVQAEPIDRQHTGGHCFACGHSWIWQFSD
jgi:hypothetical protein